MDPRIVDIKTNDAPRAKHDQGRLPLMAGPMIWYALAGVAIILSGYLFLFAPPATRRATASVSSSASGPRCSASSACAPR